MLKERMELCLKQEDIFKVCFECYRCEIISIVIQLRFLKKGHCTKMEKYSILLLRNTFKIHGPGMLALNFGKELRSRGHKVVFCGAKGELDAVLEEQQFKKITIEGLAIEKRKVKFLSNIKKLHKILKDEDINVVIGFNAFSTVNCKIAKISRKKITFIDYIVGEGKEKYLKYIPCDFITVSEYSYNRLRKFGIPKSRLHIVYPSTIDLKEYDQHKDKRESIRSEFGIKSEEILATSVAMFSPLTKTSKGQMHIINALPKVFEENKNIKFLFVGEGSTRKAVQDRAKALGIEKKVIFAGKRTDVPSIMFASDIFCHYPDQETFGLVNTEAMSAYIPVVARNIGGIADIVANNESGFLVNDLDTFIQKIVLLSTNKELRENMGIVGRRIVEEKYTLKRVIDQLERVIENKI